MLASARVTDTDVYCFDRSAESMRVFLATVPGLSTSNRLHPTIQDVHGLAYPDDSFDVVFGNAVLHQRRAFESLRRASLLPIRPFVQASAPSVTPS